MNIPDECLLEFKRLQDDIRKLRLTICQLEDQRADDLECIITLLKQRDYLKAMLRGTEFIS